MIDFFNRIYHLVSDFFKIKTQLEEGEDSLERLIKAFDNLKKEKEETDKLIAIANSEKELLEVQSKELKMKIEEFPKKILDLEKELDTKDKIFTILENEKLKLISELNTKENELKNKVSNLEKEKQTSLQEVKELEDKIKILDKNKLDDEERRILSLINKLLNDF